MDSRPSGESIATADGVWVSTLTCSATSRAWKSSGDDATDSGTTSSRRPRSRAPKISHTEKSNADEWHCVHTFPGGRPASSDSISQVTLR
ncbi:hypothetical protein PICSAR15_02985 [Mycobacterium avium subsp. paratuberculosis]|nr:hypothetical protein PICSAR120_04294 [Mycobacterium avium subsp. paratuberculosis]CAG6934235.1 hypothetical protein PICSAR107_04317 [Mycobacterium avium subsp. paratuberculosis]CAG6938130.1 hypothetical protein PICSAR10_04469 [Mycobacterium avium subsp. paratuberculosis]CAG6982576.1 hypothetical protein PICSAR164_01851 [Mycobacterium avium subsp. paratuberculosis]CAG6987532.1 hypothetical protein PICSAR14_02620 [Mycobacterium avium subsp. paratuberculosis]